MASVGQLLIAGQGSASRDDIRHAQEKEKARRGKAAVGGGWGRALGFGGSFLATMGMANPITAAIITGMGALGGRSLGRALTGGLERDADKSIDTDFYQGAQRDFKSEIGDYQQGMRNRMVMDTGRDMFSAYNLGKYMKPDATAVADKLGSETISQGQSNVAYMNKAQGIGVSPSSKLNNPLDDSLLNLVDPKNTITGVIPPGDSVTPYLQSATKGVLPAGGGNLGVTTQQYGTASNVIDFNQPYTLGYNSNMQTNTNVMPTYIGGQYQGNQPSSFYNQFSNLRSGR
jgi:hypothetical protein